MALTAQNIYDSFDRYKRDLDDVDDVTGLFLEWLQFTINFVYEKVKRVDPGRFTQSQDYAVVQAPHTEGLPSDFQDMQGTYAGIHKYERRKRLLTAFSASNDTDITYSDSGGTSAYNTDIYIQGGSSRGYTGDAAATMQLTYGTALDLTDFDDSGSSSPNNDYISIWVYIGNDVPTSVTLGFYDTSAKVNGWTYQDTSLTTGWNRVYALKSAFSEVGTGDWTSIGYVELTHAGGGATTNIYYDKLDLNESNVNGNDQTKQKLALSGYGWQKEGYYLDNSNIVFTDAKTSNIDKDYVMRYFKPAPTIDALADYLTDDASATGQPIVEDRHREYVVKAIDVLYEQWDNNPGQESISDFRFVRALDGLLSEYNRTPQVSIMNNTVNNF